MASYRVITDKTEYKQLRFEHKKFTNLRNIKIASLLLSFELQQLNFSDQILKPATLNWKSTDKLILLCANELASKVWFIIHAVIKTPKPLSFTIATLDEAGRISRPIERVQQHEEW